MPLPCRMKVVMGRRYRDVERTGCVYLDHSACGLNRERRNRCYWTSFLRLNSAAKKEAKAAYFKGSMRQQTCSVTATRKNASPLQGIHDTGGTVCHRSCTNSHGCGNHPLKAATTLVLLMVQLPPAMLCRSLIHNLLYNSCVAYNMGLRRQLTV